MADKVRSLMKRSVSKASIRSGISSRFESVSHHVKFTPYRFKVTIFVANVTGLKDGMDVCVNWERSGKIASTKVVTVRDSKAVLKESISMEHTLLRVKSSKQSTDQELEFMKKRVTLCLKKNAPDGKVIGKNTLNLAKYIKGSNSTVFSEIQLSNGSVISTKIESVLLHMGKKKKNGSKGVSETYSDMTGMSGGENDSIFDDEPQMDDFEMMIDEAQAACSPPALSEQPSQVEVPALISPSTAVSSCRYQNENMKHRGEAERSENSPLSVVQSNLSSPQISPPRTLSPQPKPKDTGKKKSEILETASLKREKVTTKHGDKKSKKKSERKNREDEISPSDLKKTNTRKAEAVKAQVKEMHLLVKSLREENISIRKQNKATNIQIVSLKDELQSCQDALKNTEERSSSLSQVGDDMKRKEKLMQDLKDENTQLLQQLEQKHEEEVKSQSTHSKSLGELSSLKERISTLQVVLKREPQFQDVVNELEVAKVSLKVVNMEKEQLFEMLQELQEKYDIQNADLGLDF